MKILYPWPEYPFPSLLVLAAITMIFLYLAREPMHRALSALSEGLAGGLSKVAEWTRRVAEQLREKNRRVILETGRTHAGERLDQELLRLESSYAQRLSTYPDLQLKLEALVTSIDADYKECNKVPPEVPGWSKVVASLTRVKDSSSDRVIQKMLSEIHKSALDGEKRALQEFRAETAKRHKVLGGMAPTWQKVEKLMARTKELVTGVLESTRSIDRYIAEHRDLQSSEEHSADLLSARASKVFAFSLIVILVASGGAFINFQLIALPMSELVPAGARIVGMQVAQLAALVIVTLELVVGIFLMEALGITNIFPQVGNLPRGKRRAVFYGALAALFFLATVEASLAILREQLVEAEIALRETLAGPSATVVEVQESIVPVVGQAILGFTLPWILAMVAIPLEMLIESSQHVGTKILATLVLGVGVLSRVLAFLIENGIKVLTHVYDAYVVIPEAVAKLVFSKKAKAT